MAQHSEELCHNYVCDGVNHLTCWSNQEMSTYLKFNNKPTYSTNIHCDMQCPCVTEKDPLLEKLNKLGAGKKWKPFKSLSAFILYETLEIVDVRRTETRYGPTIVLELPDVQTFLPKRFVEHLDDEALEQLRTGGYTITYKGANLNGFEHIIEFNKKM